MRTLHRDFLLVNLLDNLRSHSLLINVSLFISVAVRLSMIHVESMQSEDVLTILIQNSFEIIKLRNLLVYLTNH
jgi:hypothetical protein